MTIDLDHSVYNDPPVLGTDAGNGSATVVDSNGLNVVPLLAADGYHQLKGSPTIDQGATDGASGTSNIDGQERTIGAKADVGADEFAHQTSLKLARCNPPTVVLTDARLRDRLHRDRYRPGSRGAAAHPGTVSFSSSGGKGGYRQFQLHAERTGPQQPRDLRGQLQAEDRQRRVAHCCTGIPRGRNHDGSQGRLR